MTYEWWTAQLPTARRNARAGAAHAVARLLLALTFLLSVAAPALAQAPTPTAMPLPYQTRATTLLKAMSPGQKVGQLFMVSYLGNDPQVFGDLTELIVNYRVGGVQLRAANQNFTNGPDVTRQVAELANRLQSVAAAQSFGDVAGLVQAAAIPTSTVRLQELLPLFIVMAQEGDGAPYSEITQGMTPLPSQLAIGATWKPERAEAIGRILGSELHRVGVNMLLGPVLDVSESPRPGTSGDEGGRVFGGDPFWVGQLGAAYTAGVHEGSNNRIAVIAKHFPGLGSADRSVEEEIPTVQKSLEQLRQIDLAPFFSVLPPEPKPDAPRADGLLVTHIRYRGFQGNIRANTRPVSLDPQAFDALTKLPEIAPWRAAGGLMVSDSLGLRSVRRYDDPNEKTFNARKIAQDAFVAGNDVLTLGNFAINNNWPEQLANIKDTIIFFREQYSKDPQFAARVDAAVMRILSLKLRLYGGSPTLGNVLVSLDDATSPFRVEEPVARAFAEAVNGAAKDSITLLSPGPRELSVLVPVPPAKDDALVFLTDDRVLRDCARCADYPAIGRTALQDIALSLYGPRTTGQLSPGRVSSFTFSELADGLRLTTTVPLSDTGEGALGIAAPITRSAALRARQAIDQANWIVIGMLDLNPAARSSRALKDFLAQRGDALRDKKVIVFAFGAPYYLDATEISKVTAYYAAYSRTPAALEAAVRAMFGESVPSGSSPVSISAINYALTLQTAPNPAQVIPLAYALIPQPAAQPAPGTAVPATAVRVTETLTSTRVVVDPKVGDRLKLTAGPVLDRNGRVVPDGTPLQFVLSYPAERLDQNLPAVSTRNGMAEVTVTIERKGKLEIRAESNEARISDRVQVTIGDNTGTIETVRPTAVPSAAPQPTPSPTIKPTDAPTSTPAQALPAVPRAVRANFAAFLSAALVLGSIGLLALAVLSGSRRVPLAQRWRAVFWSWISGWSGYALVALGAPGTSGLTSALSWGGAVAAAAAAAVVALALAILRQLVVTEALS